MLWTRSGKGNTVALLERFAGPCPNRPGDPGPRTFRLVPFWLGVGGVIVTERLVTVWRGGPRGRLLAAAVLPELSYDMFLQLAFLRACWLTATSRDAGWNHVHRGRPATARLPAESAPSRFDSWDYSSGQT